jgi:hypothetical protein
MIVSSDTKGASALIHTGQCNFWGAKLINDAGATVTLTVYDNTQGSGKVIDYCVASDNVNNSGMLPAPIRCFNGIYAVLSAAQGDFVIFYEIL